MTGSASSRGIAGEHMRRVIGRILIAAAVALPLSAVLWGQPAEGSVGSGLGTAVMKCRHFKDAMILSPGLSHTPTDQTVAAHGRVYGCNKAGGGGTYTATLSMKGATCESRTYVGEAHFSWANGQTTVASVGLLPAPVEPLKVEVVGQVKSGMFAGLLIHSFIRTKDVFKGHGPGCSKTQPAQASRVHQQPELAVLHADRPHHDDSPEHLGAADDDSDVGLGRHPGQHDSAVRRRAARDGPGRGRRRDAAGKGLGIRFARQPRVDGCRDRAARCSVWSRCWRAARSGPSAVAGGATIPRRSEARSEARGGGVTYGGAAHARGST